MIADEMYRSVFDRIGQGLVVQRADGRIIASNDAAERILGLTRAQMEDRTSTDPRWVAVHPDGSPFPGDSHPAMVCLRTGEPVRDVVMGVHRPDDSYVWILISAEPLPLPEHGPGVVTAFTDITAEMTRASARLRATVDSMLDPHMLLRAERDPDGRLLEVRVAEANDAAIRALETSRERVAEAALSEVLPQAARDQFRGWLTEALETGHPLALDEEPFDGGWVDVRAVRVGEHLSFTCSPGAMSPTASSPPGVRPPRNGCSEPR